MHDNWWLCSGIKKLGPTCVEIGGQKHIDIYGMANKLGAFNFHQLVHYNRNFSMLDDSSLYLSLDGDWIEVAFKLGPFFGEIWVIKVYNSHCRSQMT